MRERFPSLPPGSLMPGGVVFFGPFADRNGPLNFTIRETATRVWQHLETLS